VHVPARDHKDGLSSEGWQAVERQGFIAGQVRGDGLGTLRGAVRNGGPSRADWSHQEPRHDASRGAGGSPLARSRSGLLSVGTGNSLGGSFLQDAYDLSHETCYGLAVREKVSRAYLIRGSVADHVSTATVRSKAPGA
jgi:hypothetical protein